MCFLVFCFFFWHWFLVVWTKSLTGTFLLGDWAYQEKKCWVGRMLSRWAVCTCACVYACLYERERESDRLCVCVSASILIQTIAWLFKNKEVPLSKIVIWINWLCRSITWKKQPSVSRGQTQQEEQKDTVHIIHNTMTHKIHTFSVSFQPRTHKNTHIRTQEINMTEDYILDHSLLSLFFAWAHVTPHPFLRANLHSLWDLRRSTGI